MSMLENAEPNNTSAKRSTFFGLTPPSPSPPVIMPPVSSSSMPTAHLILDWLDWIANEDSYSTLEFDEIRNVLARFFIDVLANM
ncbi:hypothetical protein PHJA_002894800 [Phtheirospermum japonicum]|uniref:Uncharacterized protein n=1 Tax=Phtheirospermum japonicum TaxID=374723 RepID=A0A830D721_9LAMI|nr:hypothetical protein PHJA_002894800 [Phtheirospermum japonicum]